MQNTYGICRIYETSKLNDGAAALRLKDRVVELGDKEYSAYSRVAEWLPALRTVEALSDEVQMDGPRLGRFFHKLTEAGLLYPRADIPEQVSGREFYRLFSASLESWLAEAFSHPLWERMMNGRGSARLFTGWMIELYHYTRNANRHMPLSSAHCHDKAIKTLRARHYAEEWNHYHYFLKSLRALGHSDESITQSVPLPMTLALSNFMRQAAREDILCYSICSAILEGTTTDRKTYGTYYQRAAELYDLPKEAIQPIFAHLDLDVQYGHSNLFLQILEKVPSISAARGARILEYGHQLVEHIWLWTENIEGYYGADLNPLPRRPVDPFLD